MPPARIFRRSLLFFAVLVTGTVSLTAQPWMEELPDAAQNDFYAVQRAFREYWKDRDETARGKGWKAFKRWEWFWEQRVAPGGRLPSPMQLLEESRAAAARRSAEGALDAGSWTSLGPSQSGGGYAGLGRVNCVRVSPLNAQTVWAGSAGGGLWKSTNGGSAWTSLTDTLPTLGVTDIAFHPTDPLIMYIATGDGDAGDTYSVGVLKSTDGGASWAVTGLNWNVTQTRRISRLLMHPADPQILIAAASNGIHKSTNGGVSWTQTSTSSNFRDMEFKSSDPSVLFASRSSGQVFRSTNTGSSWTLLSSGIPTSGGRVALGVTPADGEIVYALFANSSSGFGGLYRSTDGGATWTVRSTAPNLLGWEPDGSDAGGQGWYDLAIAVSQTNPELIFTGGVNIWKSTTGGQTWSISSMWYSGTGIPAVHADQHDLWFVPGTSTLYAGNDGGVYRSTDNGASWSWLGSGLKITQFYKLGVSQTSAEVVIAGAQDNGTKALGTTGWRDVIGGDGMECAVDYTNASIMYGTLYYGDLRKSMNGGLSFSRISGGIPESGGWVTPFALHPTSPSTIIAGYRNVWKTTDAGTSWTAISALSGGTLDVVSIAPSDPDVMYVTDNSTIYRTTDGGATAWVTRTSPAAATITAVEVHPLDPQTLWATVSGYTAGSKVYRSTNGGASWSNISGSLPNVPANTIVYERNSPDRLYVGTDIGVYTRDNTQADWVDFSGGLPNVVVSELEIQYAAGRIRAATYGRGLWESPLHTTPAPLLTASADSLGVRLAPGDSAVMTLVLTNTGTAALTWSATLPPSAWVARSPAAGTVPPGESNSIAVTLRGVGQAGDVQMGSFQILSNDAGSTPFTVTLRVDVQEPVQAVPVAITGGWNLLSVPVRVSDWSVPALFPGAVTPAYRYNPGGSYTMHDTLSRRTGYWVKFASAGAPVITGVPVPADTIAVASGWNLVGCGSRALHPSAVGVQGGSASQFYGLSPMGFAPTDTLRPGSAYWVKMSAPGVLIFPSPVPSGPAR
jgi:hypothetical protein